MKGTNIDNIKMIGKLLVMILENQCLIFVKYNHLTKH